MMIKYIRKSNYSFLLSTRKKGRRKGPDFFDKLRKKTEEAKEVGSLISKVAAEKGEVLGKQLSEKGKEGIDKGMKAAKQVGASKTETLELIEKLGKLKQDGLITEDEFSQKKKDLLDQL